jgi:hexosaminidase
MRARILGTGLLLITTGLLPAAGTAHAAAPRPVPLAAVVPAPASASAIAGVRYSLRRSTAIHADRGAAGVAGYLAGLLRPSTGFPLPVRIDGGGHPGIALRLDGTGGEGYRLDVTGSGIALRAGSAAGLFEGVQTLRQLLPAKAARSTVQSGPWVVSGGHIADRPRFAYRGAMLDVSRHFFTVAQVERYIDEVALYKINYLHLHLSDDQGWRIAISGWPRLTSVGGSTEVGGGPGGYYTRDQYRQIVGYAQRRFVTVVPEIDMPGHANAALASYAPLNCDGVAPPLYTGTDVGFSSLCVGKDLTYRFIDDVIGQLAALTPGPYLHIGGDEAQSTTPADYANFINRVQRIVAAHHKTVLAWHDVVNATPLPSTVAEFWDTETTNDAVAAAAARGTKLVMAPASRAYLDMKYTEDTPLGQDWAGLIEVRDAYGWDPGAYLSGVGPASVLGVEAPLWSETLVTMSDIEYMAFPRLPALAELAWSPESTHNWPAFRLRLAAQAPLWTALAITFYRSPQIPWPPAA